MTWLALPSRGASVARLAAAAITSAALVSCAEHRPDESAMPADQDAATDVNDDIVLHFTDVTAETGIDLITTSGRIPSTQIVEVKGGGLALIDYDGDGDDDLFVPNGATLDAPTAGPGCRLYENLGDLRFQDVTAAAGLTHAGWSMGVSVGDYDGDSHDDIFIACFGRDTLLRNTGDGRFEDVTDEAGVGSPRWGTGCAFGDVDGDGDLDLYVVSYLAFDPKSPPRPMSFKSKKVLAGPMGLPPVHDVMWINQGDGTFRDATDALGFRAVRAAYGLGTVILDFDRDGRQDVFVGNDSMGNFLFRREENGVFSDTGLRSGVAANDAGGTQATMGIAIGDVDDNGFADLFSTNFSSDTNTLHLNVDGRWFEDATRAYGLGVHSRPFLGWACAFHDFDHDADEDLLVVNGHVYPNATLQTMDSAYEQPPLLYRRAGRRFERVEANAGGAWLDAAHCDRSAVFGDLDADGDIDAVIGELNGPVRVLRNDTTGPWLMVSLHDDGSANPRGLGSRIELTDADGRRQTRWIYSGGSFQSASTTSAHFGVRGMTTPMTLEVTWPNGGVQDVGVVEPDMHLIIDRE